MSTSERTLSDIFCKAGDMYSSNIVESGEFPAKKFTCIWYHENGTVSYDGENWEYIEDARSVEPFYISPAVDGY